MVHNIHGNGNLGDSQYIPPPGTTVPPVSKQFESAYFVSSLQAASIDYTTDSIVKQDTNKTLSGIKLPPVGSYQSIKKDIIKNIDIELNSIFVILHLLTMINQSQSAVQKAGTIAEARMAVETAKNQLLSADFTLKSELASADSTKLEGAAQIVSGICNMVVGFATAALSVLPGVSLVKAAGSDIATPVAADVAPVEEAEGAGASAAADAESAESAMQTKTATQDIKLENTIAGAQRDTEDGQAQLTKDADELTEQPTKTEKAGEPTAWEKFMATGKQRDHVINALSGVVNGFSSITSGVLKEMQAAQQILAASQKAEGAYSSVRQQLTQELYQAFSQLVSDITSKIDKTSQAREQILRMNVDSQIMRG